MRDLSLKGLATCLAFFILFSPNGIACTDFNLQALDGTVIVARSMEFALDLKSNLRSSPRGRQFKTTGSDNKPSLIWDAKYGYMYMDGFGLDNTIDGVNEQGLSYGGLYLPNLAQYQTAKPDQSKKVLPYNYLGDWILSNFATVDEVRKALPNIIVVAVKLPGQGDFIIPVHAVVHDATGNSITIEYVDGKLNIYDNKVGILTNCPEFPWHITNLSNYINLKPTNPKPVVIKDMTFVATGQGSGMLGLPGDISPPSRFVKMAVFKSLVEPAADGPSAITLAEHMINNVDIPLGIAREPNNDDYTNEYTQWTVFKDLKNMKFYYKTYNDPTLRVVDMKQVDMGPNATIYHMPVDSQKETVNDVTATFKQST